MPNSPGLESSQFGRDRLLEELQRLSEKYRQTKNKHPNAQLIRKIHEQNQIEHNERWRSTIPPYRVTYR